MSYQSISSSLVVETGHEPVADADAPTSHAQAQAPAVRVFPSPGRQPPPPQSTRLQGVMLGRYLQDTTGRGPPINEILARRYA
ncbi:hypothetical protein NOR_07010 [Metarhizium rileyi]|uniref:Uncharacterized protein n=1 Tax=Metarhizium rileyi (strain RCEF 4871) TaxID=1649241 RepID=A0A166Z7M4_METRR|nr:hypothetical protein NOR_07010 [Metarhizium rileyi RCEF 4871]TWU73878.1 hypothetical protein ED733_002022 [Metarhizium rileyi]